MEDWTLVNGSNPATPRRKPVGGSIYGTVSECSSGEANELLLEADFSSPVVSANDEVVKKPTNAPDIASSSATLKLDEKTATIKRHRRFMKQSNASGAFINPDTEIVLALFLLVVSVLAAYKVGWMRDDNYTSTAATHGQVAISPGSTIMPAHAHCALTTTELPAAAAATEQAHTKVSLPPSGHYPYLQPPPTPARIIAPNKTTATTITKSSTANTSPPDDDIEARLQRLELESVLAQQHLADHEGRLLVVESRLALLEQKVAYMEQELFSTRQHTRYVLSNVDKVALELNDGIKDLALRLEGVEQAGNVCYQKLEEDKQHQHHGKGRKSEHGKHKH